jgi:hypothetical protein
VQNSIFARWNSVVDAAGSNIEDEELENSDIPCQQDDEDFTIDWDKFDLGAGLSAWDKLGESYEQDGARVGKFPRKSNYEVCFVNLES